MKGPYRIRTPDRPEPKLWEIENTQGELLTTMPSKDLAEKLVGFMNDRPKPIPAKEVHVPLAFTGTASVYVPATLNDADARQLAERIALARVLAATENPDAPEDAAFEEYVEACSRKAVRSAESDWDASILAAVAGRWTASAGPAVGTRAVRQETSMRTVFDRADVRMRIRKLSPARMKALFERIVMTLYPPTAADEELLDAEHEWSSDTPDQLYDELRNAGLIPEGREVEEENQDANVRD